MKAYPSTANAFVRDPETHKLRIGELASPEFAQVKDWFVTEKIDGMNVRILLTLNTEGEVDYELRGRSDNANLPGDLVDDIDAILESNLDAISGWTKFLVGEDPHVVTCVYGEAYGGRIQKGGSYRATGKSIRIFDVTTTYVHEDGTPGVSWWRPWSTVEEAAGVLGLKTVPSVFGNDRQKLDEIIWLVKEGFQSLVTVPEGGSGLQAEGVVVRTDPYLFDWQGHRVMFKLKTKDLP